MSFSKRVKDEIAGQFSKARHCRIAEIAALLQLCGEVVKKENTVYVKFCTENLTVAKKYFILLKKTFDCNIDLYTRYNVESRKNIQYALFVTNSEEVFTILKAVKLLDERGKQFNNRAIVNGLVIQNSCCRRAFLRGAFLAIGSMTDPNCSYHFELVTSSREWAKGLCIMINSFDMDAKIVERKKNFVVYVKEGSQIADLLNIMEAHLSLMEFENIRILKEVRNSVNRQVNCEAANINKTVKAASKQVDDIIYIRDTIGFGNLSEGLKEIAVLRIEQSEASLKELGEMLNPSIGKSGVNHRLRKLSEIAERVRQQKEEM